MLKYTDTKLSNDITSAIILWSCHHVQHATHIYVAQFYISTIFTSLCFETVGCVTGMASGLQKSCSNNLQSFIHWHLNIVIVIAAHLLHMSHMSCLSHVRVDVIVYLTGTLQECCDLGQLWYREFYLEMTKGERIQVSCNRFMVKCMEWILLLMYNPAHIVIRVSADVKLAVYCDGNENCAVLHVVCSFQSTCLCRGSWWVTSLTARIHFQFSAFISRLILSLM